ncbi:MAG: hypothetical protein GWP05_09390 [Anaerolineaceae bacterium]|nr:hypothetical protein [Anaerolineaceae bacterium]
MKAIVSKARNATVGPLAMMAGLLLFSATCQAGNAVGAGNLIEEAPTLTCLGVRWLISGDDNRNAKATVAFRAKGTSAWRKGLALLRVDTKVPYGRRVPEMFAGSIFDLQPGTTYEMKLTMSDPDGGNTQRTLTMSTRAVPRAARDARIVKCRASQLQSRFNSARPGDVILVAPGTFKGTLDLSSGKGTGTRPIVIRAEIPGKVILDAQGGGDVVNARNAEYIFLEGLVLRNARNAGLNCEAARGLVVRRCRIEKVKQGIYNADRKRPGRDFYIADNEIIGPYTWPRTGIFPEEGVQLLGTGHVVCFNRIRGWSDGISILDARGAPYPASAIDFYNNDISECTDDAIEMDTGQHNVRAMRNRITDCFEGISTQPIYGGPCYIIRNVIYNVPDTPFKNYNAPSGLVYLHNTTVRTGKVRAAMLHYDDQPVRNAIFYNNLFLGNGGRAIESWGDYMGCKLDYNGYTEGPVAYTKDGQTFKVNSLQAFAQASGLEKNHVVVTLGVFAKKVGFPKDRDRHYPPPDLRLKRAAKAVDAGLPLANVNDGFAGRAPDLGAYEAGSGLPVYGPRTN